MSSSAEISTEMQSDYDKANHMVIDFDNPPRGYGSGNFQFQAECNEDFLPPDHPYRIAPWPTGGKFTKLETLLGDKGDKAWNVNYPPNLQVMWKLSLVYPSSANWGDPPNANVNFEWRPLGFRHDKIRCQNAVRANKPTIIVDVDNVVINAGLTFPTECWHCLIHKPRQACSIKGQGLHLGGEVDTSLVIAPKKRSVTPTVNDGNATKKTKTYLAAQGATAGPLSQQAALLISQLQKLLPGAIKEQESQVVSQSKIAFDDRVAELKKDHEFDKRMTQIKHDGEMAKVRAQLDAAKSLAESASVASTFLRSNIRAVLKVSDETVSDLDLVNSLRVIGRKAEREPDEIDG